MSQIEIALKKRILRGFYWLSSLTFAGQLITWLITILVIRILRPEDYGIMAMATLFIGLLNLLQELGLGAAIIQKANINEEELKKILGCVIIFNLGLFCIIYLFAPLIGYYFMEPRVVPIIRVLGANFILMSLSFLPEALLRRNLEFRRKSLIDLFANLFSSVTVLIFALKGFGVWSLVFGMLSMQIFKVLIYNAQKPLRYFPVFSAKGIWNLLTFGSYISVSRILWYFYTQADILIGGRILGNQLLGIYSVALRLVSLPLEKISPLISQVGFPAFSRIQNDSQAIKTSFLKLLKLCSLFAIPAFISLSIIAPDIIPLLLGPKWIKTIFPIQILCFVMPFRIINTLFAPVVTGIGHPDIITGNNIIAIVIMPIAFLIGSKWGVSGFCYAWVTTFPLLFLITAKRALKVIKLSLKDLFKSAQVPIIGSIVMALVMYALKLKLSDYFKPLWFTIILISSGIGVYSSIVLFIDQNAIKEIKSLFSTK